MTVSLAHDLSLELSQRFESITLVNGYQTNVGAAVYRGKLRLDPQDLPCTVMLEGDDRVDGRTRKTAKLGQQYTVEAHADCDPNQPNDTAHKILADLNRALFSGDLTFGRRVAEVNYLGRAIGAREDGSNTAFASITFELVFSEDFTTP